MRCNVTDLLPNGTNWNTLDVTYLDPDGSATDTQDCSGQLLWSGEWQHLSPEAIRLVTADFTGSLHQIPPMFSALKRDGTPLYCLARAGITVEREARALGLGGWVRNRRDGSVEAVVQGTPEAVDAMIEEARVRIQSETDVARKTGVNVAVTRLFA